MPDFTAAGGQFWLDGQPMLVQAGEFHYFRTPADEWRHRLGLLQAAGFNTVATYIPWLWHQIAEGQSDLDGHSHAMRDLAGFLDLAADMGFWLIPRPGPYIMAETINEGIPPWVFERYPQAAFISQGGVVQNIASYLHPDFLACVRQWYQAVFGVLSPRQVTRGGKIIMVQLDNEMGMIHWVRNIVDSNPDTVARFAAYLQDTYDGQLADRYPTSDLPRLLRETLSSVDAPLAGPVLEDYRRFYRLYLRDYAQVLLDAATASGLEVPPVINIHGFANGGKTFPIGLSQLVDVMRLPGVLSATDVYPLEIGEGTFHQLLLVNEMTKALHNPAQALASLEFQAGGCGDFSNSQASLPDLHLRLCLSSGMRAVNHYLFCSGENDPVLSPTRRHDWGHPVRKNGALRRQFPRYKRLSEVLTAYGNSLTLARPETVTTIGFVLDYFMTEVNSPSTQVHTRLLTRQREVILFDMLARGLALTHRAFDAVDLDRAELDPAQRPVCWVMLEKQCSATVQHKLVDYVRQGGRLVIAGRMPAVDFFGEPCSVLSEALGIRTIASEPPFDKAFISAFGVDGIEVSALETYSGDFEEVVAARAGGEVVGFVKALGAGKALIFGAALEVCDLEELDVVHQMALAMGCPAPFKLDNWVDVRLSRGEAGSFLFLNNYQEDPVKTPLAYRGEPLFGGNTVCLPARQGAILPLDWRLNENVLVHYVTSEIVGVSAGGPTLTVSTAQPDFVAELTLTGYRCEAGTVLDDDGVRQRVRVEGRAGQVRLTAV